MPKAITLLLYTYSELDDAGKERARDWWISSMGTEDYADYTIKDAAEIAERLGVRLKTRPVKLIGGGTRHDACIWWSGFSCQGDGASFEGTFTSTGTALEQVKAHAPVDAELHRIAEALDSVHASLGTPLSARITTRGSYAHSAAMDFEFCLPELGYDEDDPANLAEAVKAAKKALRSFADWIYKQLEDEYIYQTSKEAVAEAMEANGYTFTEDGVRYDE